MKKYPQRGRQDDQRICLHLNIPVTDVPAEGEQVFFQTLCKAAIDSQEWEPCREPVIRVIRRTDSHLTVEFLIDLFPSIVLPASLAVTVEAPPIDTPQPEEIMARIEALQVQFGQTERVERGAQWGDMVCIDVIGICQGELVPQSVQHKFWLSLQSKNGPLAAALVGTQAGEHKRVAYTLAEDFPYAPWQEAAAHYAVYVHEVQALQVPIASDLPLLSDLPHVQDEESLFAALHEELRESHQAQWRTRLRKRVLAALLKVTPIKVPGVWVQESFESLWQSTDKALLAAISSHLQLPPEEHKAVFEKGFDSWQKHTHLKQQIQQDLAYQLLLWAVIRDHQLQLSASQIDTSLRTVGDPLHLSAEQVWANLQKDGEDQKFLNQFLQKVMAPQNQQQPLQLNFPETRGL